MIVVSRRAIGAKRTRRRHAGETCM